MATIHAESRHAPGVLTDVYDDGHLRVEHDNYYVACGGEVLKFRRAEFLLLSRLALNMGRIVRAEELWRHAWDEGKPYNAESLHVHVYRLRSKLLPFGVRIETMVNVGYRLIPAAEQPERRTA
ncbi:MAG TPA: helix-turn-helix domain-containing protein [Pyrinomonadaceae bacterium]|jgi:DNA-binding response OmpR family regulator